MTLFDALLALAVVGLTILVVELHRQLKASRIEQLRMNGRLTPLESRAIEIDLEPLDGGPTAWRDASGAWRRGCE